MQEQALLESGFGAGGDLLFVTLDTVVNNLTIIFNF